jgi:two-component system response regulator (stage 0 sporulation protein F)
MLVEPAFTPRAACRGRVVIGLPNPVRRAHLGDVLRRDGYQVFDAVDGEGLFRVLRASVLDLVVSDLWMPACSGLDVLQRLREACWSLPVVILAADPDPSLGARIEALGGKLVRRPFAFNVLRRALEEALERPFYSPLPPSMPKRSSLR